MVERVVMITTKDNPYDPYSQFDEWYKFDTQKGYNTCSYLARIALTSNAFPEVDNDAIQEKAIDEIVELNLLGNYEKRVYIDGKITPSEVKDAV